MDRGYQIVKQIPEAMSTMATEVNVTEKTVHDIITNTGFRITIVVIHVIAIVMAALGNGSVIFFIIKYRRMRHNVTAYLVLNLAVCDFTGAVLHQPMRLVDILVPLHDGAVTITKTYCQVTGFFASLFSGVGYYTVALISLERFLLICYPLETKGMISVKKTIRVLVLVWILALLACLPLPISFTFVCRANIDGTVLTFCMSDILNVNNKAGHMYYIFLFILYFIIPVVVITFAYVRIFITLNATAMDGNNTDRVLEKVMVQRKRLAKIMLCVAICFTVLHTPYFVTFLLISVGFPVPQNPITTLLIIEFLPLLNAVFNPFIYSANSRIFFRRKMLAFLSTNDDDSLRKKSSASMHSTVYKTSPFITRQTSQRPETIWINGVPDATADVEV